jgi:spermidine synthase
VEETQAPAVSAEQVTAAGLEYDALDSPYAPYMIAFFTAAAMMAVEMLAGRVISRLTGSSLYTWTSVIGVVLAGVTIGNYAGGILSDHWDPKRFLGWLFLLASMACISTLFLAYVFRMHKVFSGMSWPAVVFLTVFCTFFIPSLLLGCFGPVAAKMALRNSRRIGFTLGAVSAWGAAGSIVGTLVTGFWLISLLGTKGLPQIIAMALAAAGLWAGPARQVQAIWVGVVGAAILLSHGDFKDDSSFQLRQIFQEPRSDLFCQDSDYQFIRVYEDKSKRDPERDVRVLALDYLIHGYIDPKDPTHLEYDYELVYRDVLKRYAGDKKTVAAFFLGGGSYTFPRWLLNQWPTAKIDVAEIDPMVIEANHKALALPRDTPIRSFAMDARRAVDELPPDEKYDFFFGDAFNDLSSPFHLSTLEFVKKVDSHLKPDGAYLVNIIDSYETALLLGSITGTLERVFEHVYVFCTEKGGVRKARDTYIVAASHVPLDVSGLQPGHQTAFCGSLLTAENLGQIKKLCNDRVLTDDDAPVDNLIAPVLRQRKQ